GLTLGLDKSLMKLLLALFAVVFAIQGQLFAVPNTFPEENPNMLIDLPADWKPRYDLKGNLVGNSPKGDYFFKLSTGQDGDSSDLEGAAADLAKTLGKSMKDAKVSEPKKLDLPNIEAATAILTGKDAKGDDLIFHVYALSSGGDSIY